MIVEQSTSIVQKWINNCKRKYYFIFSILFTLLLQQQRTNSIVQSNKYTARKCYGSFFLVSASYKLSNF